MQKDTSFGAALIHSRLSSGYTQKEIADFTKTSRSYYGHLEAGYRKPTVDFIIRLCILYKENPITYLLPFFPEEYLFSQKHYLQYLTSLSHIKYKPDTKRCRKRKSKCWSRN